MVIRPYGGRFFQVGNGLIVWEKACSSPYPLLNILGMGQ